MALTDTLCEAKSVAQEFVEPDSYVDIIQVGHDGHVGERLEVSVSEEMSVETSEERELLDALNEIYGLADNRKDPAAQAYVSLLALSESMEIRELHDELIEAFNKVFAKLGRGRGRRTTIKPTAAVAHIEEERKLAH